MEPDDFWLKTRVITDPLHRHIKLPSDLFEVVDTPQFQRLRSILQMGIVQYVYPGAIVNRFTHCVGTAYLSQKWISQIRERQPKLDITDQDIKNVTTAGLIHDIGHAPYSHSFERWMHSIGHTEWNHEDMGGQLFEHLIDINNLDWELEDIRRVRGMIAGEIIDKEKPWLSQIVANKSSGVDTDKFDYVPRDSFHLGLPTTFRPTRLMEDSRVIGGEISFLSKEALNVYELFHSRFTLHKLAYQHRICHSIEYMIHDVLSLVDSYFKISDLACDITRYHLLTDGLFQTIKSDCDPRSLAARELLLRLDKRKLYPMICELLVDTDNVQQLQSLTSVEIANSQPGNTPAELQLRPEDIIVHKSSVNYGKGSENPVNSVKFYSKQSSDSNFTIPRNEISAMLPAHFQEHIVRVFLRGDLAKLDTARKAVKTLCKKRRLQIKI